VSIQAQRPHPGVPLVPVLINIGKATADTACNHVERNIRKQTSNSGDYKIYLFQHCRLPNNHVTVNTLTTSTYYRKHQHRCGVGGQAAAVLNTVQHAHAALTTAARPYINLPMACVAVASMELWSRRHLTDIRDSCQGY